MFQKGQPRQFLASQAQAQAPRPLSEATEIYDTDFEDDFSDTEDMSARRSIGSVCRVPLIKPSALNFPDSFVVWHEK